MDTNTFSVNCFQIIVSLRILVFVLGFFINRKHHNLIKICNYSGVSIQTVKRHQQLNKTEMRVGSVHGTMHGLKAKRTVGRSLGEMAWFNNTGITCGTVTICESSVQAAAACSPTQVENKRITFTITPNIHENH